MVVLLTTVALAAGVAGGVTAPQTVEHPENSNATVSGHPPSVAQPENTTSYLRVPDERLTQTEYTQPGVDVPGALATDRDRLEARLAAESFEAQFENASSTAARTEAVTTAAEQYERMVERARERQQTALEEFSEGRLSAQGLARNLARASATAVAIDGSVENVREVANEPLDYGIGGQLDTRFTNMEPGLVTLDGELRSLFRQSITGERQSEEVIYVEASDSDLVLAMVLGDNYLRESYIGESYDPDFNVDTGDVPQRINNLYSWGFQPANYVGGGVRLDQIGNSSVWEGESIHRQGQFVIHFDANTDNVYKERQTKRLQDVGPLTRHSRVNGSLRLVVNETHDTGPNQVRLLDNETGQPLNGTIQVDETPVGTTGSDGTVWVVDDHGATRIEAKTDDGSVSMFVYVNEQ